MKRNLNKICTTISVGFILTGCANVVPNYKYGQDDNSYISKPNRGKKQTPTQAIKSFSKDTNKMLLDKAITSNTIQTPTNHFLKPVNTEKVRFWRKYFTTRGRSTFEIFARNGEVYRPVIEEIFEKHNLPKELYFVGLIESGYKFKAKSHAGAVGPWQFIKATARRYGLKVTRSIDERKNIYKSTEAAALYFQDLYNIFGSWELALAAYNAGEYGVIRRIRGANTRDYFELSKRKILPKETRHYVPKVIAAMTLYKNHRAYGLKVQKPKTTIYKGTKRYTVKNSVSLNGLSKKLGVSKNVIRKLNHDLHRAAYIPYMGRDGFEIYLPTMSKEKLAEMERLFSTRKPAKIANNYEAKAKRKATVSSSNRTDTATPLYHKVRPNESLFSISKRYNVTLKTIRRLNSISGSKIFVGQKIKLPGHGVKSKVLYSYIVKKGENLSHIAQKFNTNIKRLKSMNRMRKSTIFIGQKLKVPAHKKSYYTVKKGDVLGSIARVHNQSVGDIKRLNKIQNNRIFVGQKIIVSIKPI